MPSYASCLLGAVSVICSDKTGTLTRNEMTVRAIATAANTYELGGTGYDSHGAITLLGREIIAEERPLLLDGILAAVLCNDASLERINHKWVVNGPYGRCTTGCRCEGRTGYLSRSEAVPTK